MVEELIGNWKNGLGYSCGEVELLNAVKCGESWTRIVKIKRVRGSRVHWPFW